MLLLKAAKQWSLFRGQMLMHKMLLLSNCDTVHCLFSNMLLTGSPCCEVTHIRLWGSPGFDYMNGSFVYPLMVTTIALLARACFSCMASGRLQLCNL